MKSVVTRFVAVRKYKKALFFNKRKSFFFTAGVLTATEGRRGQREVVFMDGWTQFMPAGSCVHSFKRSHVKR